MVEKYCYMKKEIAEAPVENGDFSVLVQVQYRFLEIFLYDTNSGSYSTVEAETFVTGL
jgi:hypothetical protein